EFPEDVQAHVGDDRKARPLSAGTKTVFVAWMKSIAHRDGGRGAHPLGIVEHVAAAVVVRHKCMLDGVEQTFLSAAMGEPVITWILREDGRVCEVTEQSERRLGGKAG